MKKKTQMTITESFLLYNFNLILTLFETNMYLSRYKVNYKSFVTFIDTISKTISISLIITLYLSLLYILQMLYIKRIFVKISKIDSVQ